MKKGIKALSLVSLILSIVSLSVFVLLVLTGLGFIVVPTIIGLSDGSLFALYDYVALSTHEELNALQQQGINLILFTVMGLLILNVFLVGAIYFGAITAMKAVFTSKAKFIENSRDSKMLAPLGIFAGLLDIVTGMDSIAGLLSLIAGIMCFTFKSEAEKEALAIARGDKKAEEAPEEAPAEEEPKEEPALEEAPAEEEKPAKKAGGRKPAKKPLVEEKEESGRKPE